MTAALLKKFGQITKTLWADTSGVILPYVTVLLVVIVGTSVLALDGARYMSLQTQMQNAADAAALAGAAELDRLSNSTNRANNAARNLLTNSALLTPGNVAVSDVRFLTALPASDNTAIGGSLCSNSGCTVAQSIQAHFVEVTVTPITMPTILPARFFGGAATNTVTSGASAVAGMDSVNCGLTPMFICNPFEQSGDTYDQAVQRLEAADADTSGASRRTLIRLADYSPSGIWGPGDFGYLVPESGTLTTDSCFPQAGDEIGKSLAMQRPLVCVRQKGVDLLTGNANAAKNGLNTRFGIYPTGPLSHATCKNNYPPDLNVRKAMTPAGGFGWCTPIPNGQDSSTKPNWPPGKVTAPKAGPGIGAFDVDACLLGSASCTPSPNVGISTWNCEGYWNEAQPADPGLKPAGCTNYATISRYDVYQNEIATALVSKPSFTNVGTKNIPEYETGAPQCKGTTPTANRRLMNVAIVNCGSSPVKIQSNAKNVPVAAFARFFLTHAVTNSTKPYAEFRGILKRGEGTVYDQVQLYR